MMWDIQGRKGGSREGRIRSKDWQRSDSPRRVHRLLIGRLLNGTSVLGGARGCKVIEWPDATGEPGSGSRSVCRVGFSSKVHMVERASRVNQGRCQGSANTLTIRIKRHRSGLTPSTIACIEAWCPVVLRRDPPADTGLRSQGRTTQERRNPWSGWIIGS